MSRVVLGQCALVVSFLSTFATLSHAQGVALPGVGPVNRSMGGAATAAPIDGPGALHWNPATIGALPSSEISAALEFFWGDAELSSTVPAGGGVAPGLPPVTFSGTDQSDSGVTPLPTVGFVFQPDDSPFSYGLGIYAVAGYSMNAPSSQDNPITTPQGAPPIFVGLGRHFADLQVLQIAPTVSYQLTERMSVGVAPTLTLARLMIDPLSFAAPDDANGDGFATFPDGTHTRYHGGGGVQAGLYYETESGWNFGASIKSPQYVENFRFNSADEAGNPRRIEIDIDYPLIASFGTSYTGFDRLLLATDVRFFNYAGTDGFDDVGFNPDGSIRGLGWDNVWSVAVGGQYILNHCTSLRLGYSFNENPIDSNVVGFNSLAPLVWQHTLSGGLSYWFHESWKLNLLVHHVFEADESGPLQSTAGPLPGSTLETGVRATSVSAGVTVVF